MKSKKSVHSRPDDTTAFDRSLLNLATLAGLPTSRPGIQSRKGERAVTGLTINMADFDAGISNLLRFVRRA